MTPSGPIRVKSGETLHDVLARGDGGPAVVVDPGATGWAIRRFKISAPAPTDGRPEPWRAVGIAVYGGGDAVIEEGEFDDVAAGVYASVGTLPLAIRRNKFSRIRGPMPRGSAVQLDGWISAGIDISDNTSIAKPGDAMVDHINLHKSGGVPESWARIERNRLAGGNSKSGSGICVGDGGSGGYVAIRRNRFAMVANVCIGVVSGSHYLVERNLMSCAGATRESLTGALVTVRTMYTDVPVSDITVRHNRGIVNAWSWGNEPGGYGPGTVGAGFWTDGTPIRLVEHDNRWQDESMRDLIINIHPPGDLAQLLERLDKMSVSNDEAVQAVNAMVTKIASLEATGVKVGLELAGVLAKLTAAMENDSISPELEAALAKAVEGVDRAQAVLKGVDDQVPDATA